MPGCTTRQRRILWFCLAGQSGDKTFAIKNSIATRHLKAKMLVAAYGAGNGADARAMRSGRRPAAQSARKWLSAAGCVNPQAQYHWHGRDFVASSGIVSYRDVATAMANRFSGQGGGSSTMPGQRANLEHAATALSFTHLARSKGESKPLRLSAYCGADGRIGGEMLGVEPGFVTLSRRR